MVSSFFAEDVAGLDIADSYIAAARIGSGRHGVVELRNAGWSFYNPGLTDKALAAQIRTLWRRCGMPTTTVCSILRNPSIAFHYFKLGNVSEDELEAALWLQGEEILQKPRDEIAIDWHLNRPAGAGQETTTGSASEGVLVAAPLKDVDRHISILEMAGLYPVILDVGSTAISNIFLRLSDGSVGTETLCLVNLSEHFADMAILCDSDWIYPHAIVFHTTAVEQATAYLCDSINNVLKYHQYKLHRNPATRLLVAGQITAPAQLLNALQNGTGLPVEIWDPLQKIKVGASGLARKLAASPGIGPLLATSFGLALRRD